MSTTNPNQPKVEASESVLPAPEEIAKIAAALSGRHGSSESAVKEAIVLYLHAYIAYRELAPLEIEKIILLTIRN